MDNTLTADFEKYSTAIPLPGYEQVRAFTAEEFYYLIRAAEAKGKITAYHELIEFFTPVEPLVNEYTDISSPNGPRLLFDNPGGGTDRSTGVYKEKKKRRNHVADHALAEV